MLAKWNSSRFVGVNWPSLMEQLAKVAEILSLHLCESFASSMYLNTAPFIAFVASSCLNKRT